MKSNSEISEKIKSLSKIHSEKWLLAKSLNNEDSDILIKEMSDLSSKIQALEWVLSES